MEQKIASSHTSTQQHCYRASTQFTDLPNELLLQVASLLGQSDLRALIAVCHQLLFVIEETLYSSPRFNSYGHELGSDLDGVQGNHSIYRYPENGSSYPLNTKCRKSCSSLLLNFVYALIEKPARQAYVRKIEVRTNSGMLRHSTRDCRRCMKTGVCPEVEMRKLVASSAKIFWRERGGCCKAWLSDLYQCYEPALVGYVLLMLPNLQHLGFKVEAVASGVNHRYYRGLQNSSSIFGIKKELYDPSQIQGLRNLRSFGPGGHVPFDIIDISSISRFETEISRLSDSKYYDSQGWKPLERITELKIDLDLYALKNNQELFHGRTPLSSRLGNMIDSLPHLKKLEVCLHRVEDIWHVSPEALSYESALGFNSIFSTYPELQTIIIDTSDFPFDYEYIVFQDDQIGAIADLIRFPNLRSIRAPQTALMNAELTKDVEENIYLFQGASGQCYFPSKIEEIQVTNVVWATINEWGGRLLEWRLEGFLPHLKRIILDIEMDKHYVRFNYVAMISSTESAWTKLIKTGVMVEQN